jgi:hypothetical protein
VLITRIKVIHLHGQTVRLFSLDGRLWVSRPSNLKAFKRRWHIEKTQCQNYLARATLQLPVSAFDPDDY